MEKTMRIGKDCVVVMDPLFLWVAKATELSDPVWV